MSNTIVKGEHGFTVTFDGATAFDAATTLTKLYPLGLHIRSIQMVPTATDDILTVREDGVAAGRIMFKVKAETAYDIKTKYFNVPNDQLYKLYVVGNEATSGAMMIVEL